MSRFNTPTPSRKTTNRAGGEAYQLNAKQQLATILLTSFVTDQYYRSTQTLLQELKPLIKADPKFAAQAAIYARHTYGMRSITHIVAAELFDPTIIVNFSRKNFVNKVIFRVDDIAELLSYYTAHVAVDKRANGKPKLPDALRKGIAEALVRFDAYQLGKYRGEGKSWPLVDIVNMVHPRSTEAITALIKGNLKQTTTVSGALSAAGSDSAKKQQAWLTLLTEKQLGYLAALRNLNNIAAQSPEALTLALKLLTTTTAIAKSKILPFQFMTALDNITGPADTPTVKRHLNKALELSVTNVPHFNGKTLVAVDTSGSMGDFSYSGSPIYKAALFGAILAKSNDTDVIVFADTAKKVSYNPDDALVTIARQIARTYCGGGTNFHAIYQALSHAYDRIIILSDMQAWVGYNTPTVSYNSYKTRHKIDPFIYSWDLCGYGTTQLNNPKVALLSGFSDKVFDTMKLVEQDKDALVKTIAAIEL